MTSPTPWSLGEDAAGSRWITAADGFRVASVSAMSDGDAELIVAAVNAVPGGYVPASLSPEWHAEMTTSFEEGRAAGAAEALRAARERVEALPVLRMTGAQISEVDASPEGPWFVDWDEHEEFIERAAVLAALGVPADGR